MFYEWQGTDLVLSVKVLPNASKDEFCEVMGEAIKLRITTPPVDGKANQHLTKFLAKQFKVSKSQIELLGGKTSREKHFKISQPKSLPETLNLDH